MIQNICDICGEVITKKLYILAISEENIVNINKKEEVTTLQEVLDYSKNARKKTKVYVVCEPCKNTWDALLKNRITLLDKEKEEFKRLFKAEEKGEKNGNKKVQ